MAVKRSQERLKVGLVGLGLAATPHFRGYAGHPQAEVVAVCDLDEVRARAFAQEHDIPQVFTSFDEMLAQGGVDVVDLATPTHLHAAMTRQAAEAGKHVHCEKPFCRSMAEGMAAVAAARSHGVKLVVGETYVFLTSHQRARQLIANNEIGRPLQIRQRHGAWLERPVPRIYTGPADRTWRVDPERSGGGDYPWIFDHAVHFFAAAEYFALDARIDEVYAVRAEGRGSMAPAGAVHDPYAAAAIDIPIITWRYDDRERQGIWMRAERLNGKYDYMRGFSTSIMGEKGMIEVLGEGGHNLHWDGRRQHLVLHRQGKEPACFRFEEGGDDVWESEISYYSQGHANQVRHLLDCILEGREPRYGGEDGVRAVRCTLAAIRSAREARPVRVDEIDPDYTA
ncbi:MAG: Gfo/Idh/MocA family oxidoreductase, partial [Candidatus Latescibacterota bacterium]